MSISNDPQGPIREKGKPSIMREDEPPRRILPLDAVSDGDNWRLIGPLNSRKRHPIRCRTECGHPNAIDYTSGDVEVGFYRVSNGGVQRPTAVRIELERHGVRRRNCWRGRQSPIGRRVRIEGLLPVASSGPLSLSVGVRDVRHRRANCELGS